MVQDLIKLVEHKHKIDLKRGESKYFDINWLLNEIALEIEEVRAEIKDKNSAKLEDELGDILWAWLILVEKLKNRGLVSSHKNIFKRALKKYRERVLPLTGTSIDSKIWKEVKRKQKIKLEKESMKNLYSNFPLEEG